MNLIFILILILALPSHLKADDWLFPVFPSGYLSSFDQSVLISGSRGTYLGSADKDWATGAAAPPSAGSTRTAPSSSSAPPPTKTPKHAVVLG